VLRMSSLRELLELNWLSVESDLCTISARMIELEWQFFKHSVKMFSGRLASLGVVQSDKCERQNEAKLRVVKW